MKLFSEGTKKIEVMGAQGLMVATTQWDSWSQGLVPAVLFVFPIQRGRTSACLSPCIFNSMWVKTLRFLLLKIGCKSLRLLVVYKNTHQEPDMELQGTDSQLPIIY